MKNILNNPMKKAFAGVSAATAVSRVLGYVRDVFIASAFGTSMYADAFFVAFRIPNLLRRLLGEGSLPAAFIPVYSGILALQDEERGKKLSGNFFAFLTLLCLFIVALGIIFAPAVVVLIAPGFASNPAKLKLTVTLARIMMPILIMITLSTTAMGILNTRKYFFIPAAAPAAFNLSIIFFFLFLRRGIPDYDVRTMAAFATVGFILYFMLMLPLLFREKVTRAKYLVSGFMKNRDVGKILLALVPAAVGLSVMQLNIFVDTICATLMGEGVVSALYFANRIYQLPLALFGVSVSIASLPFMSDSSALNRHTETSRNLFSSLASSFFLILPSAAGLMLCGHGIVKLLFQRGLFQSVSTASTSSALFYYSAGLFAFSGVKIFANFFYARKDMKTPVKIAIAAFAINIVGDITALLLKLGPAGLAAATSIAALVNFGVLWALIQREGIKSDVHFRIRILKFIATTAIMSAVVIYMGDASVLFKIPAGTAVYFIAVKILRAL